MEKIKVAIIGAGSSYTPEIIEGFAKEKAWLPIGELALYDIDRSRLKIMASFCRRFLKNLSHEITITESSSLEEVIKGSTFIDVQIRVGGNKQRILDEKIPLKYGQLGQETTGVGGMMKALRTIPVMIEIARAVEKFAPNAWIINYTNPTGLVAEAVTKHTKAKIAGLCSGVLFPAWIVNQQLNVPEEDVYYDYVGLNHLNFAYNINIKGRPLTDEEFEKIADNGVFGSLNPEILKTLKLIPSPYLQYYYHTADRIKGLQEKPTSRGEDILELEKEIFAAYADETQNTKPEALARRGGGGYSEIALAVMKAIYTNSDKIILVNVPNNGAIRQLPDDAVVEIPCVVNSSGIHGLSVPEVPQAIWGLISAVKNYEQLTVEAAMTGSKAKALLALMAHPLITDFDVAKPMLDEMLEANKEYVHLT